MVEITFKASVQLLSKKIIVFFVGFFNPSKRDDNADKNKLNYFCFLINP